MNWTVRRLATGQAIGTLQATVRSGDQEPTAELAWVIGVVHQRQGFAGEAAAMVASWLRMRGVTCLRARIHPGHDASMAVARRLGLRPTEAVEDGERVWECSCAGGDQPAG